MIEYGNRMYAWRSRPHFSNEFHWMDFIIYREYIRKRIRKYCCDYIYEQAIRLLVLMDIKKLCIILIYYPVLGVILS